MLRLTVGKKIMFGFGLLVALGVLVGSMAFWQTGRVGDAVDDLHQTHVPLAILGGAIQSTALKEELAASRYLILGQDQYAVEFKKDAQRTDKQLKEAMKLVRDDDDLVHDGWPNLLDKAVKAHEHFVTIAKSFIDGTIPKDASVINQRTVELKTASKKFEEALHTFSAANITEAKRVAAEALHRSNFARTSSSILTVSMVLIGALLAFFLTRAIIRPINGIVAGLRDASDQVGGASTQVSSSSQQLAEGASEQAAALEETSSSLEEMASITRQNAQNADQANRLMDEATGMVKGADESMQDLTGSMQEISKASQDIQKIIKTIDEIAFQTNLLALNAAVEAARAGEAGAGFAVVADEVRNLALRAAEAAKSTTDLIDGTIKRIKDGSEVVTRTNEEFSKLATRVMKSGGLVGEITAASREQAQGIEQINKSVAEMDKVVQQNAANAEESASASEELNAQAKQLREMVLELATIVGR
ncbi:MAG: methyl-accepting chemotaxis protein [Syntrophobacteraceae bacterium]